jgi:hypothetical protein
MLENLNIEGSSNIPTIEFNAQTGKLNIVGKSILENSIRFYTPILEWIRLYCVNPAEITELHIKMEYFNTSTSKYILSIMSELGNIYNDGKNVCVFWYFADEDMRELGEDYDEMLDVPFKLLEYSYD